MRWLLRRVLRPVLARLDAIQARLDHLDRRIDEVGHAVEQNRLEILAARHQAYSLLIQDLDAGTEATTLLSRGLQDTRAAIEDAVDDIRIEVDKLVGSPALDEEPPST